MILNQWSVMKKIVLLMAFFLPLYPCFICNEIPPLPEEYSKKRNFIRKPLINRLDLAEKLINNDPIKITGNIKPIINNNPENLYTALQGYLIALHVIDYTRITPRCLSLSYLKLSISTDEIFDMITENKTRLLSDGSNLYESASLLMKVKSI
jgi:hypothetical protein